jgi:hypothetical protein
VETNNNSDLHVFLKTPAVSMPVEHVYNVFNYSRLFMRSHGACDFSSCRTQTLAVEFSV